MPPREKKPIRDLAIYLLKDDGREPEKFIPRRRSLKKFDIAEGGTAVGTLFVKRPKGQPPRWAGFFEGFVEPDELGRVSNASAVLLVKTSGRNFALTFGHGHTLLEPESWEERFGLRVALNSISEGQLRSIDKVSFDAISAHTRTQSSREASAAEFGIDVEQDLVRAVTGTPNDQDKFGVRLTGMSSLHASVRVDMKGLRPLLRRLLDQSQSNAYKKTFPWIDQISEVKNKPLADKLDEAACESINKSGPRCWLGVPEIIDWTRVSGFRFSFKPKAPELPYIRMEDFVESLEGAPATPHRLSHRRVTAVDGDGGELKSWSVHKCLYCEAEHAGRTYVLNSGKWYQVDRDFVKAVDDWYATAPVFPMALPAYKHAKEGDYCIDVAAPAGADFALMDQKFIFIGGPRDKVELCDLFSTDKDLIHVKRYDGSGVLSHLFAQGTVSAEAFRSEPAFRKEALALLPPRFHWSAEPPSPADFRVVFAVVKDGPGSLRLPFFARVTLRQATRRLEAYGYRVAIAKIDVDPVFAQTKKFN